MDGFDIILENQKRFFYNGYTREVNNRIINLIKLKNVIKKNENEILKALNKDLGKSDFEGYATEVGMVYDEINMHIKNLKKWAKREGRKSPIVHFPAKSYIYKEPYGVVLIIGPFNYPFQLTIAPLIGAISAGNCAVIKPSENSVETAKLLERIINENFREDFIKVVNPLGGKETVEKLLDMPFDYIFFTGSVRVGKIVMEKAAKRLIPITLELGGKSPCIVDKDANIKMAAKRIVWGKFINAGQTCVAPDYLYVHKDVKENLLKEIKREISVQFGEKVKESSDYPRLVNEPTVERLAGFLKEGTIYCGGEYIKDERYMAPTVLVDIKRDAKVMEEEIFGPILPVIEFENLSEVISYVNEREKPLALYYFSENSRNTEWVLQNTSSGGVTINDTIIHVANGHLPFGGVGNSGVGAYHGKASFDIFTHEKAVIKRGTFIEFPIRFAPYKDRIKLLKKVMR